MFSQKNIYSTVFLLLVFLAQLGCSGEKEKPRQEEQSNRELETSHIYTLRYHAGLHGKIEGETVQRISVGKDGSEVYAVADDGYSFSGWDDGVATPYRTDENVTGDLEVEALFSPKIYTLTYGAGEHGQIDGPSNQEVPHGGKGREVRALPVEGFRFVGWSDGVETPQRTDKGVDSDLEVMAYFERKQYSLVYSAGENGKINGPAQQIVKHGEDGSLVEAIPDQNYHFEKWSDGFEGPSRQDLNVKGDLNLKAKFSVNRYQVKYQAEAHGSIDGAKDQSVPHGGNGSEVKAVPDPGYHFAGWSDGLSSVERRETDVRSNLVFTAKFSPLEYILTYQAGEHGRIEGDVLQTVTHGENGNEVRAVPEENFHFTEWSDGLKTASRRETEVTSDLDVIAGFAENTYPIKGTLTGLVPGTQLKLRNMDDEFILEENGEFVFPEELPRGHDFLVEIVEQPRTPDQICVVKNGEGKIKSPGVLDVNISCKLKTYLVGGEVSGLLKGGRVGLRLNEEDPLILDANGPFTFPTSLDDGTNYMVQVTEVPEGSNWTCELENAVGILAGSDKDNIRVDCYVQAVLSAMPGLRKIHVSWNYQDFPNSSFTLCRTRESIKREDFDDCKDFQEGTIKREVSSPFLASELESDIPYWFVVEVRSKNSGGVTRSEPVQAMAYGGLNDTGIDWCADDSRNWYVRGTRKEKAESCHELAGSYLGQDALHGRDAAFLDQSLKKRGSGSAGFDFSKVCRNGDVAGDGRCPPNPKEGERAKDWGCTRDNTTGLIWEIKTDKGVQDSNYTYSWYNPLSEVNGGVPGVKNGGNCENSSCDTDGYIKAINKLGLCGLKNWRLPTRKELLSIVDNSVSGPAINTRYFPKAKSNSYWSSSPYSEESNFSWLIKFLFGDLQPEEKKQANLIRLVSGSTMTFGLYSENDDE